MNSAVFNRSQDYNENLFNSAMYISFFNRVNTTFYLKYSHVIVVFWPERKLLSCLFCQLEVGSPYLARQRKLIYLSNSSFNFPLGLFVVGAG